MTEYRIFVPDSPARLMAYTLPIVEPPYNREVPVQFGLRVKPAFVAIERRKPLY